MCKRRIQYTLLVYTAITKAALQAVEDVIRNVVWKIAQELEFRDIGTGEPDHWDSTDSNYLPDVHFSG